LSEAMVGVRGVIHVVYTKLLHFSQYIWDTILNS
jgi:hypothetical protein